MEAETLREHVQRRLNELGSKLQYKFDVPADGVYREDGWWHVVVEPTVSNIRVYEYASILSEVEEELTDQLGIQLLLIPGIGVSD